VASVVSDSTLALLRRIKEEAMLDTVEIHRAGERVDKPSGGYEYLEGVTVETSGMIVSLSKTTADKLQADQLKPGAYEQLEVPVDTVIGSEDTVTVTSARHGTVTLYSIEGVIPLETYSVSRVAIVTPVG
jgi:hypothetical protein